MSTKEWEQLFTISHVILKYVRTFDINSVRHRFHRDPLHFDPIHNQFTIQAIESNEEKLITFTTHLCWDGSNN